MSTQVHHNKYQLPRCRTNDSNIELRGFGLPFSPISRQSYHFQSREKKRISPKEISLIMFLLAVRTASEISLGKNMLSVELITNSYNFAGCPTINDAEQSSTQFNSIPSNKHTSFNEIYSDSILTSTMSECSCPDEDSDDQREKSKVRRNALEAEDELYILPNNKLSARCERFAYDETIWENIFSHLTWRETFHMRGISRFHFFQTLPFACLTRMPSSKLPALFVPCREDLDADEESIEDSFRPRSGPWACPGCKLFNSATGMRCGNGLCGTARPTGGYRIFLGQLRRRGTVAMVRWLLNNVLNIPRSLLLWVENHRNVTTGRGKGCAWPTIVGEPTALQLLHINHRMLFDSLGGVEGMWVAPVGSEKALEAECQQRNQVGHRPQYMPRGTIVVELPASHSQLFSTSNFPHPPPYVSLFEAHEPTVEDPLFDNKEGMVFVKPRVWRHDPYQCSVIQ